MTEARRQEALAWFREEIRSCRIAPRINGCKMTPEWQKIIDVCEAAVEALQAVKAENNE